MPYVKPFTLSEKARENYNKIRWDHNKDFDSEDGPVPAKGYRVLVMKRDRLPLIRKTKTQRWI